MEKMIENLDKDKLVEAGLATNINELRKQDQEAKAADEEG